MKLSSFFLVTAFLCPTNAEDITCPCLGDVTHENNPKSHNDTCIDIQIESQSTMAFEKYCYPTSYGTTCGAHDMGLDPFCNDSNPENLIPFCNAPFCYVDPSKCNHSENSTYARSSYFPNLFYSYNTCGAHDYWNQFLIVDQLKGQTLKVGVPALYYPDHFKFDADKNPIFFDPDINNGVGDFEGMYIDVLKKLSLFGGFTIVYTPVSAHAKKHFESLWDACIQDVAQGLLDMCIGNFWETTERREKVQFSTAVFNDIFYLRVPKPQEDKSFMAKIQILFQPFTTPLWITIILATVGVGMSYTILESNRKMSMSEVSGKVAHSIYSATMELMNGAEQNEDMKIYIKGVTVTWSFFVLITVAAYTANLAAYLAQKKLVHKIISMEDCIANNCNLCHELSEAIRQTLQKQYTSLRIFDEISVDEQIEVPQALTNGTCDVMAVSKHTWDFKEDFWGECETQWLGDFVLSFKVGWPVSLPLLAPMNYWLGRGLEAGALNVAFNKYSPLPRCTEPTMDLKASHLVDPIGVESFTAPLMLLGGGIAFGLILKCVKGSRKLMKRNREIENETSPHF